MKIPTQTRWRETTFALSAESESNSARAVFSSSSPVTSSGISGSTILGRKRVGSLERPIGVRGETGRLFRSPADLEIPGRVAPARSGLPPRGAEERGRSDVGCPLRSDAEDGRDEGRPLFPGRSERGRSDVGRPLRSELLCGRDELLLEDGLPLDGRPDDGLPLEERPDVEPPDLDGGREPFEGGRRDSISILHSEWLDICNYKYKIEKGHLVKSAPLYKGCSATFYSPTRSPVQYHRRCEA